MPRRILRVAVCQLTSHPAMIVGGTRLIAEPVLPSSPDIPTLSLLAGRSAQLESCETHCLDEYVAWQRTRVRFVFDYLSKLDPVPDIIVFPEGCIPFPLLEDARVFADANQVTVVAASHSLQLTHETAKVYKSLGIKASTLKGWGDNPVGANVVTPIFSRERAHFQRKSKASIYEQSEVRRASEETSPTAITLRTAAGSTRLLCMVCAEALNSSQLPDHDVLVIPAYTPELGPFRPIIDTSVARQRPVVLANDGRFGGSGVFIPIDKRIEQWWWNDPIGGRLPEGDGLLVVDIDLDHLAPQVGVTDPRPAAGLATIGSLTYERSASPAFDVESELLSFRETDVPGLPARLDELLAKAVSPLAKTRLSRLRRLAAMGTLTPDWWRLLAADLRISNLVDLDALESSLAARCLEPLQRFLDAAPSSDESLLGRVLRFRRALQARTSNTRLLGHAFTPAPLVAPILDREKETEQLRSFLGSGAAKACTVAGLGMSGKSAVIRCALQQFGQPHVLFVEIRSDTTPQFIAVSILAAMSYAVDVGSADPILALERADAERFPRGAVVVLVGAHHLFEHRSWRDPQSERLFTALGRHLEQRFGKVILESQFIVDLPGVLGAQSQSVFVAGLPSQAGSEFFERELRRVGADPDGVTRPEKRELVEILGGHPGALMLAADYVAEAGAGAVIEDLRKRSRFHRQILGRILGSLQLEDDELKALSAFSLARVPIPPELLQEADATITARAVASLTRRAFIEQVSPAEVRLSPLLRGYEWLQPPSEGVSRAIHAKLARHFAMRAKLIPSGDGLPLAVEARYHALQSGDVEIRVPDLGVLLDGAGAALTRLIGDNRWDAARALVDNLLAVKESVELLDAAARVYANLGLLPEALAFAERAIKQQRSRRWLITEIGRLALKVRRTDVAKSAVRLAKLHCGDDGQVAVLEGRIALREGREQDAFDAFLRGTQLGEDDGWPYFYLGKFLIRDGRLSDALQVLETGEQKESGRHRPRGRALSALRTQLLVGNLLSNEHGAAERWFEALRAERDTSPEVVWAIAYHRAMRGETGVADRVLTELDAGRARTAQERARIHLYRAMVHLGQGDRDKASEEFSRASLSDPRDVFVLIRWAHTLYGLAGEADTAEDYEMAKVCADRVKELCEKVLEYDPGNREARFLIERVHFEFNVR